MPYKDKEKQKVAQKKSYLQNKKKVRLRSKNQRQINHDFVYDLKNNHACVKCGETDVCCLDFHHTCNKKEIIAKAARDWSLENLKKEISKCILLCSNCHRKLHKDTYIAVTQNKKRQRNRKLVVDYKMMYPCSCGEADVSCLDFHHRESKTKEIDISRAICDYGLKRLQKEMEKCEVICSNCHRKKHNERKCTGLT